MTEESKRKLARELEKVPVEETIIIEHDGPYIKHKRLA